MSDNSWYENGELPPVGVECEAFRGSQWVKCEIKAHMTQTGQTCAFYQMDNYWGFDERPTKFRPIKTERELAIEEMTSLMIKHDAASYQFIAQIIYDAGYRKNES